MGKLYNTLTVSIVFTVCTSVTGVFAQLPRQIEINRSNSLSADQTLELKARERIIIREGFTMAEGTFLKLTLATAEDVLEKGNDFNGLAAYPNPGTDKIVLSGIYNNALLQAFDETGNVALSVIIDGANPEIDITTLKEGRYVLKTPDASLKFVKK